MKKIYLASRYSRHKEMQGVRDVLQGLGFEVTSRWIDCHTDVMGDHTKSFTAEFLNEHPLKCHEIAEHDLSDLMAADTVISFTSGDGGKGGRHVEFGFALAMGKDLFIVGPRENAFHTLLGIKHFDTWPELARWCANLSLMRRDIVRSEGQRGVLQFINDTEASRAMYDKYMKKYRGGGLRTPQEWADQKQIKITDPDGWRGQYFKEFDTPINEEEFDWRMALSTIINLNMSKGLD